MKPIIVYPGSKYDFYPEIRERVPKDIRVLCEPFVGGGSTMLNLLGDMEFNIEKVILGDLSPRVAAFWQSIVSDPIGLADKFDELFKPFDEALSRLGARRQAYLDIEWFGQLKDGAPTGSEDRYNKIAAVRADIYKYHAALQEMVLTDPVTTGAHLALMHNISYSGVAYLGGVSYQRAAKTNLGSKQAMFKRASKLLSYAEAEVYCGDFSDTCSHAENLGGAFIYLDPPYVFQAEKLYEQGDFDHERLSQYLLGLSGDVRYLLSYDDSVLTRSLYRGNDGVYINTYKLPRGYCAGSAGKENALNGEELFISNYKL